MQAELDDLVKLAASFSEYKVGDKVLVNGKDIVFVFSVTYKASWRKNEYVYNKPKKDGTMSHHRYYEPFNSKIELLEKAKTN